MSLDLDAWGQVDAVVARVSNEQAADEAAQHATVSWGQPGQQREGVCPELQRGLGDE